MTSPDMAAPPGTYPAQLLSTLQEIQACGIGKEGKLLIQALAAFGDGITKEFYHGFTNVVDAVQAGFDALGEALSGEPGMGGILGFANDIQGTVLGAIELSEVLLGDVTEILKQLALGLGCNDTTGPIAENIGQSLRDALAKLTMVMRMLFTLIEVITGVPGASMEDLAAFLQGKWDAIGAVSALAQRIRDKIFEAFGFLPTGDDENDLLGALMAIPQGNVNGLTDALANVNEYIQNLVNAILQAVRGIPVVGGTLADIIADIGDLQQTADTAQTTSTETRAGLVQGWNNTGPTGADAEVYSIMQQVKAGSAQRATQAWVGNETDMATFPRSLLFLPDHGHGSTGSGGDPSHSHSTSSAGGEGFLPSFTPAGGTIYFTPVWVDRVGQLDKFRVIAGGSGWFNLGLSSMYYGLYTFARSGQNGTLTKVWDSGDVQSSTNVSQRQEFSFQLPATAVEPGQLLFMATVQNRVLFGGGRPVAALPQGGVQRPADVLLRGSSYTTSGTTLPASATLSALSINTTVLPWFAASVNPVTP